jgi:hypothetical protein
MFENRELKRAFEPQRAGENYLINSFITYTPRQILLK